MFFFSKSLRQSQRAAMLAPRIRSLNQEVLVRVVQNLPRLGVGEADLLGEEEGIHLLDELPRIAASQMPLRNQPDVLVVRSAPHRVASQNPCKGAGPECRPVDVVVLWRPDGLHDRRRRRRRRRYAGERALANNPGIERGKRQRSRSHGCFGGVLSIKANSDFNFIKK